MARRKRPKIVLIDDQLPSEEELDERLVAAEEEEEEEGPFPKVGQSRRVERPTPLPKKGRHVSLALTLMFAAVAVTVLAAFIIIPLDQRQIPKIRPEDLPENCLGIRPLLDWDVQLHELECDGGYWEAGKDLSDWLLDRGISYRTIIQLQGLVKENNMPTIKPGNPYMLLHDGNFREPRIMAYQPDPARYILLQLKGGPAFHYHELQLRDSSNQRVVVNIQRTLADAMFNREFGLKLTEMMEEPLKYQVDLFHLKPGDQFTLLFGKKTYESGLQDLGDLQAIRYKVNSEVRYAFYYSNGYVKGFFNEDGQPLRTGFLKAPLRYGRISSPYNLKRSDPFTGHTRAHLGTDYAAPAGTEILAVADGIVLNAEFKANNGNYVKLLHSDSIQTQYLHMQVFAEGIRPGVRVRQGQVIGYVGMTGRATGPHVCFRFWQNGEQVDHRKLDAVQISPSLDGPVLEEFMLHRDSLWEELEPIL